MFPWAQSDPSGRLVSVFPAWLLQLFVAFATLGLAVGVRLVIEGIAPNVVPFALIFPAITLATLIAGGRAGLLTLILCQISTWYFIVPPAHSFAIPDRTTGVNIVLVTLAQLVVLWAIARYQAIARGAQLSDRKRIDSLQLALREIDHRTKNNFQIAVSLLTLQARGADDPALKASLARAVTRLQAIASVYRNLAISSETLTATRLHEHLEDICSRLREGLLSPAIDLQTDFEEAVVPHDLAIRIGLIVNEQITNAAKHAFPDGIGSIRVALSRAGDRLDLRISDDGRGYAHLPAGVDGLGTRLVALLARQIGAEVTMDSIAGTSHHYRIPLPALKG